MFDLQKKNEFFIVEQTKSALQGFKFLPLTYYNSKTRLAELNISDISNNISDQNKILYNI